MAGRKLDEYTLNNAARDMAGAFLLPSLYSKKDPTKAIWGRDWTIQSLCGAHFTDEVDFLLPRMKKFLGTEAQAELKALLDKHYKPLHADDFAENLANKLAINPDGTPIKGKVGTTVIGNMVKDWVPKTLQTKKLGLVSVLKPVQQRIYAGQEELLYAGSAGALVMNISAEIALLALDALVDGLDEGTSNAVIEGRTGAQPADPDAATTGTLLFTLAMSDPAFLAGSDQANGTVRASADTISDDTSADATGTVGYCRVSATNDGSTPIDDHIDGEAGTAGADFNFNTVSIVSGATISMTSYTITLDQGSTAT